jgi:N-acetylglucosaminyl-diphospho-decaprenol L-rhamnosyltransferase
VTSKVVAAIVSHGHLEYLRPCLEALARDGVPAAVLENIPDGSGALAAERGARAGRNPVPRSPAVNWNAIVAATTAPYILVINPDTEVQPGAVQRLVGHLEADGRRGVAGPRLVNPDGTLQRSRRRFPTVGGTLMRRTPARLLLSDVERSQSGHYLANVPTTPVRCDWMLGAGLLLRRAMLDDIGGFDEQFPMYGEDIELQYRAWRSGWEVWYVPEAVVTHRYDREIDRLLLTRRTLWHARGMARFLRRHPETVMTRRSILDRHDR